MLHSKRLGIDRRLTVRMRLTLLVIAALACGFTANTNKANAQVSVEIGPEPVCPYGFYDAPPYTCAPYGYYGPEWFVNGVFIGAGPWFHGPANFHGHVNNHFHPEHGYKGPTPARGEARDPAKPVNKISHFKGNEVRDGRGHVGKK
jgi:hypothetical protein